MVDEVLTVGDAEFQKKAIGKMDSVSKESGRTVLFVSHNMNAVRNLCKTGVVLKNGTVDYVGTADECVDHYLNSNRFTDLNIFLPEKCEHKNSGEGIFVTNFKLLNNNPKTGDDLTWEVVIQNDSGRTKEVEVAINFSGKDEVQLMEFNSKDYGKNILLHEGTNVVTITKQKFPLLDGNYLMNLWVGSNNNIVDWYIQCFVLHIESGIIGGIVPTNRGYPIFTSSEWNIIL